MRNNLKTKRTHDQLYLNENRYNQPKEMFKFISKHAFKKNDKKDEIACDFGCAAGEYLFYLNKKFPLKKLIGVDVRSDLLQKAKKFLPQVKFLKGSVLNKGILNSKIADKSFLIGVHPIFDNFEKCFSNLIHWTKPRGTIYICDMFNKYPVDVLIKYKLSKNYTSDTYESGWNIFSEKSVSLYLKKNKRVKSFTFKNFDMPFKLRPKKDFIRSWTINSDKKRIMTNGLSIIQQQTLLSIKLK